jgi:hypothetical protein
MKQGLITFLLCRIISTQLSAADNLASGTSNGGVSPQTTTTISKQEMTIKSKVSFGNHSALRVARNLQEKIRNFYRDVLGCEITKKTEIWTSSAWETTSS